MVDVERPIRDDDYPNEDYGVRRILIPSGLQWLDGERALWYARSRHGTQRLRPRRPPAAPAPRPARAAPATRASCPGCRPCSASWPGPSQTDVSPREAVALARLPPGPPGAERAGDLKTVRGLVLTPPEYGGSSSAPTSTPSSPTGRASGRPSRRC